MKMIKEVSFSIFLALSCLFLLNFLTPAIADDASLFEDANRLWEEKSYHMAIEKYQFLINQKSLPEKQLREVKFKLSDSLWRSKPNKKNKEAIKSFEELIEGKAQDRWQAEANESLAEHYLLVDRWSHQEEIKKYLSFVRDYWAGATDIKLARSRFIKASFTLGDYISTNWGWYYTAIEPTRHSVKPIPINPGSNQYGLDTLYKEVLKVAVDKNDKAKAHYSIAMALKNRSHEEKNKKLVIKHFNTVINDFSESEWLDDSYYQLGQFYAKIDDFPKAVETYRNLLNRFRRGESQWVNNAQNQIKQITDPQLHLSVGNTFLPGSEIRFNLNWCNIDNVQFNIYALQLTDEVVLDLSKEESDYNRGVFSYQDILHKLVISGKYKNLASIRSWLKKVKNEDKHIRHEMSKGLAEWLMEDEKDVLVPGSGILEPGAYLLLAEANGIKAYDLLLVTDMGMITKIGGHSALFYTFDAKTGKPRPETNVTYHYRYNDDDGNLRSEEGRGITDEKGLLNVALKAGDRNSYRNDRHVFAVVSDGTMQAFSQSSSSQRYNNKGNWWLYAFTDRPAYRPNETVSVKGILRNNAGSRFSSPEGMRIKAKFFDPRGNTIKEAEYSLNTYGSFNDQFVLDEKAPLGQYRLSVYSLENNKQIASASLFRLEEYKLPEFRVDVNPKEKKTEPGINAYRLGETVDVVVDAQYYYGGAVADAEVEYLVYQNNYAHFYQPERKYPWYYKDMVNNYYSYGHGTLVKKEIIKTDEKGRATFSFKTPEDSTTDLKYHIEVRIVDQSRREIRGSNDIKVTRHSFYPYLTPKQSLYRPGDRAEVDVKTVTANDKPVPVEGKITVKRNWWKPYEPDPNTAPEEGIREQLTTIGDEQGYYSGEVLFTKFIKTDEKGKTVFAFEPDRDGFYSIKFTGFDSDGSAISSSTNVYVCDKKSRDIGYRYGGIQIITEKDTYLKGEIARVMLVSDNPDAWVLLATEAGEIYDHRLIHLNGPVKLVNIPIIDDFIPNVFLRAVSPQDYQLKIHNVELIIPPKEKFLNITITSDKETYSPREEGVYDLQVTDQEGKPVVGELAFGIVDQSVYYIQSEYAQDIRQFFYGAKRSHSVSINSSFSQKRYLTLERDEKKQLISSEEKLKRDAQVINAEMFDDETTAVSAEIPNGGAESPLRVQSSRTRGALMKRADFGQVAFDPMVSVGDDLSKSTESLDKPNIRSDFRSTVIWKPSVITDNRGKAQIKTNFPDSLTTWQTTARVITPDTRIGTVTHEVRTKKDVIVRLQAPRFFTERDEVTISANVHNYTDKEQNIKVTIDTDGLKVKSDKEIWVTVPPEGEERVDWQTVTQQPGTIDITVMAQAKTASDAMKKTYAVIPHGIEKFIANALVLKNDSKTGVSKEFTINVPKERIKGSTSLEINLSPSIAASLLDALPYLADYPYGCVEQTMSRFLPSIIVADTFKQLGLSERDVNNYIQHVLVPREDPAGHPERSTNVTMTEIDKITQSGLKRLYDFQHADGGWGWWKEGDSDRFMSAYVVWGLSLARQAGIKIKHDAISRGILFLTQQLVEEEDNADMLAWMLHALASANSNSRFEQKQSERLWNMRNELNPYTRALFALSEHYRGRSDRARTLARNLANGIQEDTDNATAHWGEGGIHYRWSEGGVEATAFAIKALSNIEPQSPYLEPAVKWMALNRRGARWKNTRDTAIAILGLADYLKASRELNPDYSYEVAVNGKVIKSGEVNSSNIFTFKRRITLPDDALTDGVNTVQVTINGQGSLYLSGYLKYFTLEENITAAGNEVFVTRKYFRKKETETLMKGYVSDWTEIESGDQLKSGERVKVEITLEAKNNYEYLVVEDFKLAGLEAVELKSGTGYAKTIDDEGFETNETVWLFKEFRDKKVAFFISGLPQGKHRITYVLRAEVPGEFHGMPNQTHAMYVPEIRANSAEMRLNIVD